MTTFELNARIMVLLEAGLIRRGEVNYLGLLHDDRCPKLRGGDCGCRPAFVLNGKRVEVPTA